MIKTSIEKMAEPIGFDIGASDDVTQGNLINGFCRGFLNSIPDNHRRDLQVCYLVDKLTPESHKLIKELAEGVMFKEQNKKDK